MSDRLVLTTAEVAFLLAGEDAATVGRAARLLAVTEEERAPATVRAGLGSLVLRGLASPVEAGVELAPAVAAVAAGMLRPRGWVEVGLVSAEGAESAVLVEVGPVRFLVSPRPFRCLEFAGIDTGVGLDEPLVDVARRYLDTNRPSLASFHVSGHGDTGGWVTVGVAADGAWTFAVGRDPDGAVNGLTRDDGVARLRLALTGYLAAPTSAGPA